MNISAPVRDARDEAAVLKELLRNIPGYTPEWPPPAGTFASSLMRVFARYMSILIAGLNQVPDRSLLAFLDMMGMHLLPAQAALADRVVPSAAKRDEKRPARTMSDGPELTR